MMLILCWSNANRPNGLFLMRTQWLVQADSWTQSCDLVSVYICSSLNISPWIFCNAELSTAAGGACDVPTDAVGNSGLVIRFAHE